METRLNGRSFGRGKTWAETVGGASGVGDALPGGELEPEDCVGEIGGGALPVFVALRKIELRLGSALLGGAEEPFHGFLFVLGHAATGGAGEGETVLRIGVILFRRARVPGRCSCYQGEKSLTEAMTPTVVVGQSGPARG